MGSKTPSIWFCKSILAIYFFFFWLFFWWPSATLEPCQHLFNITAGCDNLLLCRTHFLLHTEVRRALAPIHPDLGGNEVYVSLWCRSAGGPANESDHRCIRLCPRKNSRRTYALKQHEKYRLWSGRYSTISHSWAQVNTWCCQFGNTWSH